MECKRPKFCGSKKIPACLVRHGFRFCVLPKGGRNIHHRSGQRVGNTIRPAGKRQPDQVTGFSEPGGRRNAGKATNSNRPHWLRYRDTWLAARMVMEAEAL